MNFNLEAVYNKSQTNKQFADFVIEANFRIEQALNFIGIQFVNKARSIRTYQDRTGRLRGSIGYTVFKNGAAINQNYLGEAAEQGASLAESVAVKFTGYALVVVAGMNYAAYVEARGFDVISGSAPESQQIAKELKEYLDF